MTATNLGLGGNPVRFLGAYIINLNNQLGLAQQPSTCNVTLVEDENASPQVLFNTPEVGSFQTVRFGGNFKFSGIVTSYTRDVRNLSGRQIQVNLSDVREVMGSIPLILAPGFRNIVSQLAGTECSVVDAFGAYDDFVNTGINLSGWNQAGMTYERIALALKGGSVNIGGNVISVPGQVARAFGERYYFILDDLTAKVDPLHRINSNLISLADFIQEMATRHSLDWFVESERNGNRVNVTIRVIDRSVDNTDLALDDFLANNSGVVISSNRGFELRNETGCTVLLGAPIEQMRQLNITGMANNPIDLSDEGGSNKYFMTEEEMRYVLGSKESWKLWVELNGGLARYAVGGIQQAVSAPVITPNDYNDVSTQLGINPQRNIGAFPNQEKRLGQVYEKLKGHAEATYGKRFLFQTPIDVDFTDAAWTVDVISGNDDPNEYFRNEQGKTRIYVEFQPTVLEVEVPSQGVLGIAGNFGLGKGDKAPQPLVMDLAGSFRKDEALVEADKADWIIKNNALYVAATLEEGGIVRIDTPVIQASPPAREVQEAVEQLKPIIAETDADGNSTTKSRRAQLRLMHIHGEYPAFGKVHAKAYQPAFVYLPTRSKFNRYGPVFSSNIASAQGKLNIEQDDGFAPWEFGSIQLMLDAMQFKVDNESSSVKTVETATVTLEGFPKLSIGQALGLNSNINSISVSLQNQVTTTYQLRSFLRRFGELSKEELAALSIFARRGGARTLPQDTVAFIDKYRPQIARQFGGRGSSATSSLTGGARSFE